MFKSFMEKKPVEMDAKSVASGLAPPSAGLFVFCCFFILTFNNPNSEKSVFMSSSCPGRLPFELCRRYVEQIVLVSDEEIGAAVSTLYRAGLVVEPSGAAAFAALINNKIFDLEGKEVVCVLSGGNVGKDELANFPD